MNAARKQTRSTQQTRNTTATETWVYDPTKDLSALSAKTVATLSAECDLLLKLAQVKEAGLVDSDTLDAAMASTATLIELSQTLLTGITEDLINLGE